MSTPLDLAARRGRPSLRPITTGPLNKLFHINRSSTADLQTDGWVQPRPATWTNHSPPDDLPVTQELEHSFLIQEPTDAEVDDYRRKFQGYLEQSWKGGVPYPPREVPEERIRFYAGIRELQDDYRSAAVCDGHCDADNAWDGTAQQQASRRGFINTEEESRAAHGVLCTCCRTSSSSVPYVLKRNMHSAASVPPDFCLVGLSCEENPGNVSVPMETITAARPVFELSPTCHHLSVPEIFDKGDDRILLNMDFDTCYRESIQDPSSQSRAAFSLRPSFQYPPAPASQVSVGEAFSCLPIGNQESPCHPSVDLEWPCCNTLISPPHFPYEFVTMPNAQRDGDAESLPSWPGTSSQRSLSSVAESELSPGVPPSKSQFISCAPKDGLSEVNYGVYKNDDLIAPLRHYMRIRSRDDWMDSSFISDACTFCAADRPDFPPMKRKLDSDELNVDSRKRARFV